MNACWRAQTLAETTGAQLALAVGALSGDQLSLALRQETVAMVAMDMLRRYLNGWEPVADYPWLDRVEKV